MNLRFLAICGFIAVCLAQSALAGGKSSRSYESASRSDKSRSSSKEVSVSVSISKEVRGSDSRSREKFFWGYKPWNGPYIWPKYFPAGKGKEQSPINIETKSKEVGFDRLLTPLKFNYDAENDIIIKNNGRGFIVEFDDKTESGISGGPLNGEYKLKRMIVHWGKKDSWGSEHLIDGKAFAGEIQLVHYNKAKYGTFDEASTHGDGLAMLTVFLKLSEDKNRAITLITKYLRKIRKPFMEVKLVKNEKLFLTDLLPEDVTRFWTYAGSLTQPPLTENSIWIILRDPIAVHKHQLKIWRKLYPHNRRPVQPLRDRVIRSSFHEMKEKKAEKEAGSQQEQQQEKPKQQQ